MRRRGSFPARSRSARTRAHLLPLSHVTPRHVGCSAISRIAHLQHRTVNDSIDSHPGPAWENSPAMRPIAQIIEQVAESNATVLIRGESGVGKELVARGIHRRSSRREMPFVKVNCAALPDELLESELLGHERARSPEQTPRVSASSRRRISARFSSTRSPS